MSEENHKLREDLENLKNTMLDLVEWKKGFDKDVPGITRSVQTTSEDEQGTSASSGQGPVTLGDLMQEVMTLKKLVDSKIEHKGDVNPSSSEAIVGQKKPAPPTTSAEQSADLKKQHLIVNSLQDRVKELEKQVIESQETVRDGVNRISVLTEKEETDVAEANLRIDKVDRIISEKLALQREELRKIADDLPEPINYDPFNYGEAFKGEVIDFEARRRLFEMKLLMNGLQNNYLAFKALVGPRVKTVDLGYKIVRMDHLLEETQFHTKRLEGELTEDDVMVIEPNKRGDPSNHSMLSKNEMFESTQDTSGGFDANNSIMQTMYRLQIELAALQKTTNTMDTSNTHRALDSMQHDMSRMKKNILSRRDIEDMISQAGSALEEQTVDDVGHDFVSKDLFAKVVNRLKNSLGSLEKAFKDNFSAAHKPAHSAGLKVKAKPEPDSSCLSCDRPASHNIQSHKTPNNIPMLPKFPKAKKDHDKMKTRMIVNKGTDIGVNGCLQEFSLPNSHMNASGPSMMFSNEQLTQPLIKSFKTEPMCSHFVKGVDGKMYMAGKQNKANDQKAEDPPCVLNSPMNLQKRNQKTNNLGLKE